MRPLENPPAGNEHAAAFDGVAGAADDRPLGVGVDRSLGVSPLCYLQTTLKGLEYLGADESGGPDPRAGRRRGR